MSQHASPDCLEQHMLACPMAWCTQPVAVRSVCCLPLWRACHSQPYTKKQSNRDMPAATLHVFVTLHGKIVNTTDGTHRAARRGDADHRATAGAAPKIFVGLKTPGPQSVHDGNKPVQQIRRYLTQSMHRPEGQHAHLTEVWPVIWCTCKRLSYCASAMTYER